jgi:methanogenic corrinoid protein MtbC1
MSSPSAWPSQKDIEIFADLCVSQDQEVSQAFADHFLESGLNKEDIYLELIAPTARYLGSQWDDDCMDFSQVNLGLIRLHAIANEIRFAYNDGLFAKAKVNRVLIASAPGSLHMLGTSIVAEFFRKEDWQVVVVVSSSTNELVQAVSNEWFDVIGLSISIEQQLTNLADLIDQLKRLSLNPRLAVLLGGPIFSFKELLASHFGADDICVNAKHAVSLATSLLPKD